MKNTTIAHLFKVGLLANVFEWYEFSVFGFLSITIGKLFFQSDQAITEILQVFTLFAVSYLTRPIGSVFFGILGDTRGRSIALKLSLSLMAVPTVLIGLLPTYQQAGLIATITLVILRVTQGFATGGELPATACYVFETAPPKYRSLLCSTAGTATKIGLLLGSCTAYLLTYLLSESALLAWGWRIPFLLSMPLTAFIAYIRNSIQEPTKFSHKKINRNSYFIDLRQIIKPLIQGLCLCSFATVSIYVLTIWMPFYLHHFLHLPLAQANLINTFTLCAVIPLCLGVGLLAQYIGYKNIFGGSILLTIISIIPLFKILQAYSQITSVLLILSFCFATLLSLSQGLFVEATNDLFTAPYRSLGVSLSITLPAALLGGTTPLVCTYVIHKTGWILFPAYYVMAFSLLALPSALRLTSDLHKHINRVFNKKSVYYN